MNFKQKSIRSQWVKLFGLSVVTATVAYAYPSVASFDENAPSAAMTETAGNVEVRETPAEMPSTEAMPSPVDTPADMPSSEVMPDPVDTPSDAPSAEVTPDEDGAVAAQSGTLTQVVTNGDSFNTLESALKAAGLDGALSQAGPFTVFAPTDEAFAALPPETLEALLKPENQAVLQQILAYHVVSGSVTSDTIEPGEVATVEGNSVAIAQDGDTVTVSGARVVEADIAASNGVIHAIDQVLIPPGLNLQ